jgi:predicted DNA-binding transcriptional regulator AlpA
MNRSLAEQGIQWLSAAQLAARYGINKATVWRWVQRGALPRGVRLSDQCTRWRLDEIERRDAARST